MIILTQKKNCIINFSEVDAVGISDKRKIYAFKSAGNNMYEIGVYDSYGRAKEIVKSIFYKYAYGSKIFEMPEK